MSMARYTGHDLVVIWAYTGGSVDLSGDFRNFSTNEEVNDADATAGNDTYSQHLPTFADADGELEMLDIHGSGGTAGTAAWANIKPRTSGTVHWYPVGTASGSVHHSVPAYIQTRNREFPYDDVVALTVAFQFSDEPTDAVVA
jgi:hypothetical protein